MLDCAQPDDYCLQELVVHVASYHADRSKGFNEVNPGLGLKIKRPSSRWFLSLGGYENSFYRPSVYAGIGTDMVLSDHVALRFTAAGATGYLLPVMPVIVPELVLRAGSYGVAIGYLPKLEFNGHGMESVVSLSVLKRF
jgi:hypothetical protein